MFKSIRESLTRTRQSVFGQIAGVLGMGDITEETWEDLETLLVQADIGVPTTLAIVDRLRERVDEEGLYKADQLTKILKEELRAILFDPPPFKLEDQRQLTVIVVVGVNGSGKTTSIGKLSRRYQDQGYRIMLGAGDTFRAAAIDQLKVWGDRADVPVISGEPGGDPAAVAYDSIRAARARGYNLLFIDTAGRLHTKFNLMRELEKVIAVCQRSVHEAPHDVLLVLDAPTGQNAFLQAQKFAETVNVTGVILTKLDGTAKGGMVFAIYKELGLPVRFIGTGEGIHDLAPFDPDQFVDALFE
ncbi:MAG: signal recognition particle-docking protein FtsY [Chloroflexota bacterium]